MSQEQPEQLQFLVDLARDRSAAARSRLVRILGDLFSDTGSVLTVQERELMTDILRSLIKDVETAVRKSLAERLAGTPGAPHELVKMLANDTIEVAYPLLARSNVLQDIDLIEIVRYRTAAHRLAIASRGVLSADVTDALVEAGDENALLALLDNAAAEISTGAMAYLVEKSENIDTFRKPILNRRELTEALARRMYRWVSQALRDRIIERFEIDPGTPDDAIGQTVDGLVEQDRRAREDGSNATRLARRLEQERGISPRFLVQTLRQGEIDLFEEMFAEHTGLGVRQIRRIIFEPGGAELALVCKAVEIEKADFASIFLRTRSARPGDNEIDPRELPLAMSFYDEVAPDTAWRVLARLRRDPDFVVPRHEIARAEGGDRRARASAGTAAGE